MNYFAAFDEYGGIFPTTIRWSEEAAVEALRAELKSDKDPFKELGVVIGTWKPNPFQFGSFAPTNFAAITWVRGWRAGSNAATIVEPRSHGGTELTDAEMDEGWKNLPTENTEGGKT